MTTTIESFQALIAQLDRIESKQKLLERQIQELAQSTVDRIAESRRVAQGDGLTLNDVDQRIEAALGVNTKTVKALKAVVQAVGESPDILAALRGLAETNQGMERMGELFEAVSSLEQRVGGLVGAWSEEVGRRRAEADQLAAIVAGRPVDIDLQ
jgi:hypothetical protein